MKVTKVQIGLLKGKNKLEYIEMYILLRGILDQRKTCDIQLTYYYTKAETSILLEQI